MASTRALSVLFLSFLLFLCLLLSSVAVPATTDADAEAALSDAKALLEFKRCITSDPLAVLSNWNSTTSAPTACNWTGITCSKKRPGRVVQIELESAALRGSLPPHVANLSYLQVLDVGNNSFSGKIPPSLGRLRRLKVLDLCINEFEGVIPREIGNLSSLQFIGLCTNSFEVEIPQSLAKLQSLTLFSVSRNQLGGQIPSWLGALHKLEYLDLSENKFQGVIPPQLGNLSSLQYLNLALNYLSGFIPFSLASLHRVNEIHCHQNNLTGSIPPSLRNLTALRKLSLSDNNLQGHLPSWMGTMSHRAELLVLRLASNEFTGNLPQSWQNVTQFQELELSGNRLAGRLPSWLGRICTHLEWLNLGQNHFTSGVSGCSQPIPFLEALSNCSELNAFQIYDNGLTGTLPANFGSSFPNVQLLELSQNFMCGNIPESIGNLSSVNRLNLHDNMFSGVIPSHVATLRSLQGINLSKNKLRGNIPSEFSLLNKTLEYLYIYQSNLSGSIPANIGELVNIRGLDLHGNLLSGRIPSELGNCHVLEELILSGNSLSGAIPPEVAGLKSIVFYLDLSANALSGEVPTEITGLQMTQYIDLSNNQLSGSVASYMDSWLDAREINLTFNNFTGNLSKSIGNRLTQLQRLDLSRNYFTGSVPSSLLNGSNIHFLNLSYNNFSDEMPCLHSFSNKLRLSRWSFIGNPYLCGRCFDLPACTISAGQHRSHSNKNVILRVVLAILGGLVLLVVVVTGILFRRIRTSKGETPTINNHFLKISVEELHRATGNFSDSNLVGEGTHGKVYRGILMSGELVAVKLFSSTNQQQTVKSFRKECGVLGKVRHRNILKIITVVWSEDLKAVIMPFMSNGSLHSLLHSREDGQLTPLNLRERLTILTELASGLSYLHHDYDCQIIHCDIKPANVLLDGDMTVKICDFGISRLMGEFDGSMISSSLAVKGSAGYIAPEYGIGERISAKGDVYSFGVVALEVMTRLKPTDEMFSGDLTLPLWIFMALQETTAEERREALKDMIKMADESKSGGGIQMDKDEEMSAVEKILMVGLRCTCQDASMRPGMKEVESILKSITIGHVQNQGTQLIGNFEEIIRVVESQPPLLPRRAGNDSSSFSD